MQTDIDKFQDYMPSLSGEQSTQLKKYYETLLHFNAKVNLISAATAPFAAKQHFADSVLGLDIVLKELAASEPVYDFGSGNGFPGIVLGVLRPEQKIILVERDLRKAEFLKHVSAELKLKQIEVYSQNFENLPKDSVTQGITRALGSIGHLVIQMTSLFKSGGRLFHFKSDSWTTELANCPTQVFTKWDIQMVGQYTLPESTIERAIVSSLKI